MRLLACVLLCMFSVVAVGQDADSDAAPEMAPPGMAAPASDATTLETIAAPVDAGKMVARSDG